MPLLIQYSTIIKSSILFIYIPLCLYLYDHCFVVVWSDFSFTFHYASTYTQSFQAESASSVLIYIPLCLYLYVYPIEVHRLPMLFTFHYASTYTQAYKSMIDVAMIYIPLCLYLYKIPTSPYCISCFIYIPLCLYLYINAYAGISPANKFTFHYASTYTW